MMYRQKIIKTCLLAALLVLVACNTGATPFHAPALEGSPVANEPFNITFDTKHNLSQPKVYYRSLESTNFKSCDVNNSKCRLKGKKEGNYKYYFLNGSDSSTRFPKEGYFYFTVSEGNNTYRQVALNLTNNDPENFCSPWDNDFTCSIESMQGSMINLLAKSYQITNNSTYYNLTVNLSLNEYGRDLAGGGEIYATCDIDNNDFDCNHTTGNEPDETKAVNGPVRQGSLIKGLAKASVFLNNSQITEAALNYTKGHPESCNIWQDDYNCSNLYGQARMVSGLWEAYKATGRDDYYTKAKKLSKRSLESSRNLNYNRSYPFLLNSLVKTYKYTENFSYADKARQIILKQNDCLNRTGETECSIENKSIVANSLLNAYQISSNPYYLKEGVDHLITDLNNSCDPWGSDFKCGYPDEQGLLGLTFWRAFSSVPGKDFFSDSQLSGELKTGNPITFEIDITGLHDNPLLFLEKGDRRTNHTLSLLNESATVSSDLFAQQTVYSYYYKSSNSRFPHNGSLKIFLAHKNDSLVGKASNITKTGVSYCDPFANDYNCLGAHHQGRMIEGLGRAYRATRNGTYREKLLQLSTSEIDTTKDNSNSYCDHYDGDYNCNPGARSPPGSVRQGILMSAMWDAYSLTNNRTIRDIARSYTEGHPDDCNVWDNDYNCSTEQGQGLMIEGLLNAYRSTGNKTFLQKARNLSAPYLPQTVNSSLLIESLWQVYGLTENKSYLNAAQEDSLRILNKCEGGACQPKNYSFAFSLGIEAFKQSLNDTYYNKSYKIFKSGSSGSCDPQEQEISCNDADSLGVIISSVWDAYSYDKVDVDGDLNISVNQSSLQTGDTTQVTCWLENSVANGSNLIKPNMSVSAPGFSLNNSSGPDDTIQLDSLEPGEVTNNSWQVTALTSGEKNIECSAASENKWQGQENVQVETKKNPSSNDDGDDGPDGSTGGISSPFEPQKKSLRVNFDHESPLSSLKSELEKRSQFKNSLKSLLQTNELGLQTSLITSADKLDCLTGWRNSTEYKQKTVSWLNLTWNCPLYLETLLIYDQLPHNFSEINVSTKAGQVILGDNPLKLVFEFNNVSRGDVMTVKYESNKINITDLKAPIAILKNHTQQKPDDKAPEINISGLKSQNLSNFTARFATFSISPQDTSSFECVLKHNNKTLLYFNSSKTVNRSLVPGMNLFYIECMDSAGNSDHKTIPIYHNRRSETKSTAPLADYLPLLFLLSAAILSITLLVIGNKILLLHKKKKIESLIQEMEDELGNNEINKAIGIFETIKDLHEDVHGEKPSKEFWLERLGEVGIAMRIYILLDITAKKLKEGKVNEVESTLDNLQRIYDRFLKRNPNDKLKEGMKDKARKVNQELEKSSASESLNINPS